MQAKSFEPYPPDVVLSTDHALEVDLLLLWLRDQRDAHAYAAQFGWDKTIAIAAKALEPTKIGAKAAKLVAQTFLTRRPLQWYKLDYLERLQVIDIMEEVRAKQRASLWANAPALLKTWPTAGGSVGARLTLGPVRVEMYFSELSDGPPLPAEIKSASLVWERWPAR